MTYAPGTGRAFGGTARKCAGTPACVHASKCAVCVRGKNRRPSVTRRHHRASQSHTRDTRSHANGRKTRVNHTYLWNVAEKRFFKSFPLEPFFTNLAALEALFTFSSAIRTENTPPIVVSRKALARGARAISRANLPPLARRGRHRSRGARLKHTHTHACAHTYPSSSAPSSSSCVVKGRLRRARRPSRGPRAKTDRSIFSNHHIGLDVSRMRI